ncbi:hypothetical protein GUI12_00520 [Anaplasmataceae bacterium AB001_6]|nr:hypothetical protein GUI12_00520 [Anaplasmataceae bacterium AB001_6]
MVIFNKITDLNDTLKKTYHVSDTNNVSYKMLESTGLFILSMCAISYLTCFFYESAFDYSPSESFGDLSMSSFDNIQSSNNPSFVFDL